MITFHRDGPKSLNKTFLSYETGKRLGKNLYLNGAEKKISIKKVKAPRKGRSGANNQRKHLKFS